MADSALLLLCVASLFGSADAAACTPNTDNCAKLTDGKYCPVNNVKEHGDINRDVKQIAEYLKETPPKYDKAKTVYKDGLESSKGGGKKRTLMGLAQKDMTVNGTYTNVFYSGAVALYGTTDAIWHTPIMNCFEHNGICAGKDNDFRTYIINKGLIGVVTAYVTYEMGAAVWKGNKGQTADGEAPYAWDEAAAFYVGNIAPKSGDGITGKAPGNLYSPYEFNWKRDTDFEDGTSLHTVAIPILNFGLINLRSYNAANVATAQTAMYKIISIAAIRSAIKYSAKAYNTGIFKSKYVAEGWAYWRSASGYLSQLSQTSLATVQEVDSFFAWSQTSMNSSVPCMVKTRVESLYKDLGIQCTHVGNWKSSDISKYGGCSAACNDGNSAGTLPSGSTVYVDMCKAEAQSSMAPVASQVSLAAMTLSSAAATQCLM